MTKLVIETFLPCVEIFLVAFEAKRYKLIKTHAERYAITARDEGFYKLCCWFTCLRDVIDVGLYVAASLAEGKINTVYTPPVAIKSSGSSKRPSNVEFTSMFTLDEENSPSTKFLKQPKKADSFSKRFDELVELPEDIPEEVFDDRVPVESYKRPVEHVSSPYQKVNIVVNDALLRFPAKCLDIISDMIDNIEIAIWDASVEEFAT